MNQDIGRHGALCVGVRLLCVGPRCSLNFCVGPRRFLCWAPSLYVSGSGAFCVGRRHSLCRGPVLSVSGPGALSLSVSGPRRCLCWAPPLHHVQLTNLCSTQICFIAITFSDYEAVNLSIDSIEYFLLPSLAVCAGPRRSLCRAPALSVWMRGFSVSGPSGFCVGSRRSLSGAFCVGARRYLCRIPALFVSGPGTLCVGVRRSLCRCPALSVSAPGALFPSLSEPLCVSGPGAFCIASRLFCVGR